jgi:protein TonB
MPDDAAKTTDAKVSSAGGGKSAALPDGAGVPKAAAVTGAPSTLIGPVKPGPTKPAATARGAPAPGAATGRTEPTLPDAPKSSRAKAAAATPVEGSLIGSLDADERIRASGQQGERILWTSAIVVTLLYTSLIAGHVLLGAPLSQEALEQEKRRRGQDAPPSISVELVPDPDKTSKTKRWQEGAQAQTPNPEQPPQPEKMASIEQQEVPEVEAKPIEEQRDQQEETTEAKDTEDKTDDEPRSEDSPMLLDIESLVDAAAADFKRNVDHALAKRPQKKRPQQQAALSGGGMKVRGTGASGKSDAFSRSVIAALMKTRPGPFALWGRVLVSFEISPSGRLNYVRLLRSSGNSALDKAAVDAIHKASFATPPPGLTAEERTYIIDYIFG